MRIKQINSVEILSSKFTIIWDKTHNAGGFDWHTATITVGIRSIKTDPLYTFSILSHEIFEVILTGMAARFENERTGRNFLFNFDHQTFENAVQIHAQVLSKFIEWAK